jgi:hypothetical protein
VAYELPACSIVPQPTALPHAPWLISLSLTFKWDNENVDDSNERIPEVREMEHWME